MIVVNSAPIKQWKLFIEEKIKHSYLDKYIQKPHIDEDKLAILTTILNHSSLSEKKIKYYMVATMLVQIALDTHDLVPLTNDNKLNKRTQLSVLAGDYYFGLFYLLLSEIEDFEFTKHISSAIKEVNEYKMNLYDYEMISLNEYIDMIKKIESLLLVRVAEFINEDIVDCIDDLLITSKLIKEKRDFYQRKPSPILDLWFHQTNQNKESLLKTIQAIIQRNKIYIKESVSNPNNYLSIFKNEVYDMLDENLYCGNSLAEEG